MFAYASSYVPNLQEISPLGKGTHHCDAISRSVLGSLCQKFSSYRLRIYVALRDHGGGGFYEVKLGGVAPRWSSRLPCKGSWILKSVLSAFQKTEGLLLKLVVVLFYNPSVIFFENATSPCRGGENRAGDCVAVVGSLLHVGNINYRSDRIYSCPCVYTFIASQWWVPFPSGEGG